MNYQSLDLIRSPYTSRTPFPRSFSTRGGVRCEDENPTNFAGDDEWNDFGSRWKSSDMAAPHLPISPPMFRRMMLTDELKMMPHEAPWHTQRWSEKVDETDESQITYYKKRRPENCHKFATNPNFVVVPDDYPVSGIVQHYKLNDEDGVYRGNGYKVGKFGEIRFPKVYYASTRGFGIGCTRQYMTIAKARVHLRNGTGDILGRRTVPYDQEFYRIVYLVRTYHMQFSFDKELRRRNFAGSDCILGISLPAVRSMASYCLTAFTGPRPPGKIAHHKGESWDNDGNKLAWITISENNMKVNQDPQ
jgi:hypothetical protein